MLALITTICASRFVIPDSWALSLFATSAQLLMFRDQMTYGLFPVQGPGLISGSIQAIRAAYPQGDEDKFTQLHDIRAGRPAVASVVGFTGGKRNELRAHLRIAEKPYTERKVTATSRGRMRGEGSWRRVAARGSSCSRSPTEGTGGRPGNAGTQLRYSPTSPGALRWAPS